MTPPNHQLSKIFALCLIVFSLGTASAHNMFLKDQEQQSYETLTDAQKQALEANRPMIQFPDSFQIQITTNDYALNLTELVYFDKANERVRIQFYYAFMGLVPTKGFDIVLDQKRKLVAVQSDEDCRYHQFSKSLLPVSLFFGMFNQLTDYHGIEEGLHKYKVKQFDDTNELSPKLFLLFDDDKQFRKSRIDQINIGSYDFHALIPFQAREFTDQDWIREKCEIIDADILDEGKDNFMSFTRNLILQLLNQEVDIMEFLGYGQNQLKEMAKSKDVESDDEDFDE